MYVYMHIFIVCPIYIEREVNCGDGVHEILTMQQSKLYNTKTTYMYMYVYTIYNVITCTVYRGVCD